MARTKGREQDGAKCTLRAETAKVGAVSLQLAHCARQLGFYLVTNRVPEKECE